MTKLTWIKFGKGIVIWLPTVLLSVLFLMQGLMKLTGMEVWVERFREYGYPEHFYLVAGVLELGGALLLFVPRTAWIGASTLGVVMLAAAGSHLLQGETFNAFFTLTLASIFGVIAYARRPGKRLRQVAVSS
jgi:putative oxidoreductase